MIQLTIMNKLLLFSLLEKGLGHHLHPTVILMLVQGGCDSVAVANLVRLKGLLKLSVKELLKMQGSCMSNILKFPSAFLHYVQNFAISGVKRSRNKK